MTKTLLKTAILTLLTLGILGAPALSSAQDASPTGTKKGKSTGEKFFGPVTAVDTNAMTFVINDQTFTVTSSSKITLAKDHATGTLADAVVGEPARGTYTKSADGKNEVTKVRFGKKAGAAGGKSGGKKKKSSDEGSSMTYTNAPAAPPQN